MYVCIDRRPYLATTYMINIILPVLKPLWELGLLTVFQEQAPGHAHLEMRVAF